MKITTYERHVWIDSLVAAVITGALCCGVAFAAWRPAPQDIDSAVSIITPVLAILGGLNSLAFSTYFTSSNPLLHLVLASNGHILRRNLFFGLFTALCTTCLLISAALLPASWPAFPALSLVYLGCLWAMLTTIRNLHVLNKMASLVQEQAELEHAASLSH